MCKQIRRLLTAAAVLVAVLLLPAADAGPLNILSGPKCFGCATGGGGGDTFAHGDSVTITGSGFGTHPMDIDFLGGVGGPIESTALNGTPSNTSAWVFNDFGAPPVVKSDSVRGKTFMNTLSGSGDATTYESNVYNVFSSKRIAPGAEIYWTYVLWANYTGTASTRQFKLFRIGKSQTVVDENTNVLIHCLNGSTNLNENTGGSYVLMDGSGTGWTPGDRWVRVEVAYIVGTQGGSDGNYQIRFSYPNGSGTWTKSNWMTFSGGGRNNTQVLSYPDSNRYGYIGWQHGIFNGLTNMTLKWDDAYVQRGTFKRVELRKTLGANEVGEIQSITSWSDTSVTIKLNQGGLAAGDYYLVVLGDSANDSVLASKQITISQLLLDEPHVFDPVDAANDSLIARLA